MDDFDNVGSEGDELLAAAIALSDALHTAEVAAVEFPKVVDDAWLRLSLAIEGSRTASETESTNAAPQAVAQSVRAPGKSAEAEDTGGRGFESHQSVGAAPLTPFAEQMAVNEAGWELVRRKADTSITRCRELAEAAVSAYKSSVHRQLGFAQPSAAKRGE